MAGTPVPPLAQAEDARYLDFDPTLLWDGGFIASIEVRREVVALGHSRYWLSATQQILDGEEIGTLARAALLLDVANGMAVRSAPTEIAFPNLDLTAHLLREPVGDTLGFETEVSYGSHGVGVASSRLHDARGPLGSLAQVLALRSL